MKMSCETILHSPSCSELIAMPHHLASIVNLTLFVWQLIRIYTRVKGFRDDSLDHSHVGRSYSVAWVYWINMQCKHWRHCFYGSIWKSIMLGPLGTGLQAIIYMVWLHLLQLPLLFLAQMYTTCLRIHVKLLITPHLPSWYTAKLYYMYHSTVRSVCLDGILPNKKISHLHL